MTTDNKLAQALRELRAHLNRPGAEPKEIVWADALDAIIAARGEAVYALVIPAGSDELFAGFEDANGREVEVKVVKGDDGLYRYKIYTEPPAPKVEITDAMCMRAALSRYEPQDAGGHLDEMREILTAALENPNV